MARRVEAESFLGLFDGPAVVAEILVVTSVDEMPFSRSVPPQCDHDSMWWYSDQVIAHPPRGDLAGVATDLGAVVIEHGPARDRIRKVDTGHAIQRCYDAMTPPGPRLGCCTWPFSGSGTNPPTSPPPAVGRVFPSSRVALTSLDKPEL